ncbi:MAG: GntR family transcriptional regulator [Victivallaceae bacterium]
MMQTKTEAIAEKLQVEIANSVYTEKLPSEQEIAKIYCTTPVTASKALNLLRDRNIIIRVPRLGSFVNKEHSKPLRIFLGNTKLSKSVLEQITATLKKKFPQLKIEIDAGATDYRRNFFDEGYDIVRTVATFRLSYSKYVKPFPSGIINKYLQNGNFFNCAFDIHRDNQLYYGLPVLISPIVVLYNKELLTRYKRFDSPYDLKLEDFVNIKNAITADGDVIFATSDLADAMLRYFVFSCPNMGDTVDFSGLKDRLLIFSKLFGDNLNNQNNKFHDGNVLFTWTCRQSLHEFSDTKFKWDILPLPCIPGRAVPATGEFLTVSNRTSNHKAAFEVAEAFLSYEIQKIIADNRFGLPIMKSLIADTLDTHSYRDDIFVNDLSNLLLNNALEQDINLNLYTLYHDMIDKKYDFETFIGKVEKNIAAHFKMREAEEKMHCRLGAQTY